MSIITITTAKRTLNRAFAELNQAEADPEKIRQAAEKGWRAAREAVYALMKGHGEDVHGTLGSGQVANFEANVLGRPRGAGAQPLTDGYARAKDVLHGECFYDGRTLDQDIQGELSLVGQLIEQAERDGAARGRSASRRRRYH